MAKMGSYNSVFAGASQAGNQLANDRVKMNAAGANALGAGLVSAAGAYNKNVAADAAGAAVKAGDAVGLVSSIMKGGWSAKDAAALVEQLGLSLPASPRTGDPGTVDASGGIIQGPPAPAISGGSAAIHMAQAADGVANDIKALGASLLSVPKAIVDLGGGLWRAFFGSSPGAVLPSTPGAAAAPPQNSPTN